MSTIGRLILERIEKARRNLVRDDDESMGEMFRTARVVAGISLRDAACRIGVSDVLLGEYERGVSHPKKWKPLFQKLVPNLGPSRYITTTNVSPSFSHAELLFAALLEKFDKGEVLIKRSDLERLERGGFSIQRCDDPIDGLRYKLSKNS